MKKQVNKIKEAKRAARLIIGQPNSGKYTGPYIDLYKEDDKTKCREKVSEEEE